MIVTVRPYQPTDLGQVLDLWERTGSLPTGPDGLTVDQAIDLMASEQAMTVLAEADGRVVGMALGLVTGVVGWLYRLVAQPDTAPMPATVERLLDDLELEAAIREGAGILKDKGYPHWSDTDAVTQWVRASRRGELEAGDVPAR